MNTAELKKLAEAATPGPWLHEQENIHAGEVCCVNQGGQPWVEVWAPNWIEKPASSNKEDAAYIAAANPAAILKLLAINAELVDALSVVVLSGFPEGPSYAPIEAKARAALEKAEGGEL